MKRIGLILIVLVLLWLGVSVVAGRVNTSGDPPDVKRAPYLVQTVSRVYYAKDYHYRQDGALVLSGYYVLLDKRWVFRDKELPLDRSFGKPRVLKR